MRGRLSPEQINELINVTVELDLYRSRDTLLSQVPARFCSIIPTLQSGSPREQLTLDLDRLNKADLVDGIDPLKTWLTNAINFCGGVPEAKVFQRALDRLQLPTRRQQQAPRRPLEPGGATWHPSPDHPGYQEAVFHLDARIPVQFLEDGQRAAESVALVSIARFEQGEVSNAWDRANGTGWLIAPRLLITAYHLVNARLDGEPPADNDDFTKQALNAQIIFGYDREDQPGTVIGVTDLIGRSCELDYVILQLEADPGVPALRLARDTPTVDKDSHPPLNIIQHRLGQPKMLAIRSTLATAVTELPSDLGYFTATAAGNGASGAPIFNDDWRVVAMHRATGRADGVVFQGLPTASANVGTRITVILDDLQSRSRKIWRSIRDAQTQGSRPQLSLVRPATSPSAVRLRESTDALRMRIQSIARSYGANETHWIWDKDPLGDDLDEIKRQLNVIGNWLADAERSRSGLRRALDHHNSVADEFVESLSELEESQTVLAKRAIRCRKFERTGESLLALLTRIQEELSLLGHGDLLPGPS